MRTSKDSQSNQRLVGRRLVHSSSVMPMRMTILCSDENCSVPLYKSSPITWKEARAKHLICNVCRKFLATREVAPSVPNLLNKLFKGEAPHPAWSWVIAEGFGLWVKQQTVPANLWIYTRSLLLERLVEQKRAPERVVVEVEVRHGTALLRSTTRLLNAEICASDLLHIMRQYSCQRWRPLCECFETHTPARREHCPGEQAARLAGIYWDPDRSKEFSQVLGQIYGPFTLEWLLSADHLFCAPM